MKAVVRSFVLGALVALPLAAPSSVGADGPAAVPDVHFAVIRLDYLTGAIKGSYEFSQSFRKMLPPPGATAEGDVVWRLTPALDFGGTEVHGRLTGQRLVFAETIWAGRGRFLFPPEDLFNPAIQHGFSNPETDDVLTHFFFGPEAVTGVWSRVRDTDVVRRIAANGRYRVFIFDHYYSVGLSDPTTAEWIVIVFNRPTAPPDLGIVDVLWPRGPVTSGVPFTPEITLHNFSDVPMAVRVSLDVRSAGILISGTREDAGALAPDESRTIRFAPVSDMDHPTLDLLFSLRTEAGDPWTDTFSDNDVVERSVAVVDGPVFRRTADIPAGGLPLDFDGDLDVDIVGMRVRLSLWQNDGYGRFTDITAGSSLGGLPLHPRHAEAGDFNDDGQLDLLVVYYEQAPRLLTGDGTGTFTDVTSGSGLGAVSARWHFAALDIDGDADLDLVFQSHGQETVMENDGTGYFVDVTAASGIISPCQTEHISAADLDGDGDPDLVFTNWQGYSTGDTDAEVFLNQGDGTFQKLDVVWGIPFGRKSLVFDQDQDGREDILFIRDSRWGPSLLYRQVGALAFEEVAAQAGPIPNAFYVDAADVTGDALPDLVFSNGDLLLSDHGALVRASDRLVDAPVGTWALGNVHFADIDGDADVDVYSDLAVYLNQTNAPAPPGGPGDDDNPPPVPGSTLLEQNFPNPFNPHTTIRYTIDRRDHVSLRIYDVAGRAVRTLVDGEQSPREAGYAVRWDGRDDRGNLVASGIYFCCLRTSTVAQSRKLVLLR